MIALDFDGTLVDCRPRQEAVTRAILSEIGIKALDFDAVWARKREGWNTLSALENLVSSESIRQLFSAEWLRHIEADEFIGLDEVFPWTMNTLVRLARISPLCLVTSRQRPDALHATLRRLEIDDLFEQIIAVPVSGAMAAKAVALRECGARLHCGDSEVDAMASASVEIPFLAVASGQRSAAFLKQYPCVAIADDVRAVLGLASAMEPGSVAC